MLPVVTAAEMRSLDRATSDEVGVSGFTLMETAGRGVADTAIAVLLSIGNEGAAIASATRSWRFRYGRGSSPSQRR